MRSTSVNKMYVSHKLRSYFELFHFNNNDSIQPCPTWTPYSNWTDCTVTCGQGVQQRSRDCLNGEPGDIGCEGNVIEQTLCNTQVS